MIGPMVAEFQLVCFESQCQPENLVSQTDAENRPATDKLLHSFHRVSHCLWVARSVREKNAIWVEGFNLLRGRRGRHDCHVAPYINQPTKNVLLHTKIIGRNPPPAPRCRRGAV